MRGECLTAAKIRGPGSLAPGSLAPGEWLPGAEIRGLGRWTLNNGGFFLCLSIVFLDEKDDPQSNSWTPKIQDLPYISLTA